MTDFGAVLMGDALRLISRNADYGLIFRDGDIRVD